jgi:chromosome segregation ATPase
MKDELFKELVDLKQMQVKLKELSLEEVQARQQRLLKIPKPSSVVLVSFSTRAAELSEQVQKHREEQSRLSDALERGKVEKNAMVGEVRAIRSSFLDCLAQKQDMLAYIDDLKRAMSASQPSGPL